MKARDSQSMEKPNQSTPDTSEEAIEAALLRAAQTAYRRAAFFGNKVAIMENGKVVKKTPVPVDPESSKPPAHQKYKLV